MIWLMIYCVSGRTSGSLAWRLARGETTTAASGSKAPYVFTLTDEEKKSKVFHVRYSCAKDEYIRVSSQMKADKSFASCVHKMQDVFRKEEHDWKMVYLARSEGAPTAAMSWKFDFTGQLQYLISWCYSHTIHSGRWCKHCLLLFYIEFIDVLMQTGCVWLYQELKYCFYKMHIFFHSSLDKIFDKTQ